MTLILRMDSEQVHACAYQLRANSAEIRLFAQSLAVSARTMDWYSPARDVFQAELEHLALALTRLADEGDLLAVRAQREADEWTQIDEHFVGQFAQVVISYFQKG